MAKKKKIIVRDKNFWHEAVKFAENTIGKEVLQKKFKEFCIEQKFTYNETLFFRKMIADALEFELTMAILHMQCENPNWKDVPCKKEIK